MEKLAKKEFSPQDIVVIGDNIRDVQAGQAIGAVTVAVASGPMSYEDLSASKPDHLFRDFSDTRAVLKVLT